MMTDAKTLTIWLKHSASIPNARWCEAVDWEPRNEIDGADYLDGGWWDDDGNVAGLVWFGDTSEHQPGEEIEVSLDDLRVASCGDCRVIGPVVI